MLGVTRVVAFSDPSFPVCVATSKSERCTHKQTLQQCTWLSIVQILHALAEVHSKSYHAAWIRPTVISPNRFCLFLVCRKVHAPSQPNVATGLDAILLDCSNPFHLRAVVKRGMESLGTIAASVIAVGITTYATQMMCMNFDAP